MCGGTNIDAGNWILLARNEMHNLSVCWWQERRLMMSLRLHVATGKTHTHSFAASPVQANRTFIMPQLSLVSTTAIVLDSARFSFNEFLICLAFYFVY